MGLPSDFLLDLAFEVGLGTLKMAFWMGEVEFESASEAKLEFKGGVNSSWHRYGEQFFRI